MRIPKSIFIRWMFAWCLLPCMQLFGQTITIGTGTGTTSDAPIKAFYG